MVQFKDSYDRNGMGIVKRDLKLKRNELRTTKTTLDCQKKTHCSKSSV
jgi:hypothetical protein